ncbi:MAG: endonuclease III [Candidatus Aenigmarchaeota archaeon]|nr:endonuclease III [Candidatus Aenigmarchaeota archaeon]
MNKRTMNIIISKLNKVYDISWKDNRGDPFEVLIGTILSQRTKDEVTWPTNEELFKKIKSPDDFLEYSEEEIADMIYPVGFYNQKAKYIKELSKILVEDYGGIVPGNREELMRLPGVGGKTADCTLCYAFDKQVIPVDIHVEVISKRLGIANWKDKPEIVREKLHKTVSEDKRNLVNALFVEHGKKICTTRKAYCDKCPIEKYCPKIFKES